MAFHPFGTFRKHKKVIFAALTIICMFSFVLCSGVGRWDPVQQIAAWFGGKTRQTVVVKISGKEIDEKDVSELRRQRDLANKFILQSIQGAFESVRKDMSDKQVVARLDPATVGLVDMLLRNERNRSYPPGIDPDMLRMFGGRPLTDEQKKQEVIQDFRLAEQRRNLLRKDGKEDDARLLGDFMTVLQFEMWFRDKPREETLYFGGSLRLDDMLDFVMWRQHADKLGIELAEADIRAEINREVMGRGILDEDRAKADEHVRKLMTGWPLPVTAADIYKAVGDELRVYLAQTALCGYVPGARHYRYLGKDINHVPALATPAEFWKYYQDNRTTLRVALLPIKVDSFLKKVDEPTKDDERELKDLFTRFKNDEPNPDRDQPGFKLPRRVQVEWVSGTAKSPRHQKLARELYKLKELLLPPMAATPGNLFTALTLNTQLAGEYERRQPIDYRMTTLANPAFALSFYRDLHTPANVAALLGQLQSAGATGGPLMSAFGPLMAPASYQASAYLRHKSEFAPLIERERKKRAAASATLFMAWANPRPSPWNLAAATELTRYAAEERQYIPLEAVKDEVLRRIHDNLAKDFVVADLNTIIKELDKRKNKPADARKFLDDKIKELGLNHGQTKRLQDQHSIADDEGLKPLKEAYLNSVMAPRDDPERKRFAELFMSPAGTFIPEKLPKESLFGTGWATATEPFLFWKTEDIPAKVQSFEDARPQVVKAWQLQKARELARVEAKRILDEVRKLKDKSDGLRFLNDVAAKHKQDWGLVEDLDDIARLVRVRNARIGAREYEPYKEADQKINARPDFVDVLMKSLKEPGDATIVWNKPGTVYYVTLLTNIARPTIAEFYSMYQPPTILSGSTLWQMLDSERRREQRLACLKQLRNEAGAENGKWVVPDEVRKRFEGRDSEE
jgi:hypothetical protein